MFLDVVFFVLGVALLVAGAYVLVTGGSRLAKAFGVPSVLVGLTVVAWGTSAPELVVSLTAALGGSPDIMLGNVMGSNVANVGLILGIAIMLLGLPGARDGVLSLVDGLILTVLFGWVTVRSIVQGLQDADESGSIEHRFRDIMIGLALTAVGAAGLIFGGRWIVESASNIALGLGASDIVIGLTLVAVGTSLPELAASLMAAVRHEPGLALGNVVGSNLFNLLAVAGPVAMIKEVPVGPEIHGREMPSLVISTLLLAAVLVVRGRIHRMIGVGLLVLYVACVIWWIT